MWRSSRSSGAAAPEVGASLTVLAIGVLAAVAAGNAFPPARGWVFPLVALALAAGCFGLRDRGRGWWLACGVLLGAASCAWAPRVEGLEGAVRLPVRFIGTVRDGWSEGLYGHANRIRVERLEARGQTVGGWRELRIEVAGIATAADLPMPGQRIVGTGELATQRGRALTRPTLRVESVLLLEVASGGSAVDRTRGAGVAALQRAAGTDVDRIRAAGLAAALFFGRQELLRSGEVAALRMSGLAHLLAVSGLNVGLVAVVVWAVLVVVRLRPSWRRLVVAAAVVMFSVISGGFAPVRRAAGAAVAYLLARGAGRPLEPLPVVWAIVAGLVLLEPDALLSPGFQLSAGVTLALVRWVRPVSTLIGMLPKAVADAVAVAVVAQVAAAPLQGAHFAFVPPLALVANLAVSPVTLAMTALSMMASLAAPFGCLPGGLMLDAVGVCQAVLDRVAAVTGGGALAFPPVGMVTVVVFCVAAVVALSRSSWARVAAVGIAAGVVGWLIVPGSLRAAGREVRMLPIGDGMSVLVRSGPSTLLVDGGRSPREAVLALAALRIRTVDAVAVTHSDADHIGGIGRVLEWVRPDQLILPRHVAEQAEIVSLRRMARRAGVSERLVGAGERLRVGSLTVDVLWPEPDLRGEDNDASLVLAVRCGTARIMVTGDIEAAGERALLASSWPLTASVLQLPHHGSRTSSTGPFLAAVDPVVALAAAGERPRYRYPHPETARRARERGIVVLAQPDGYSAVKIEEGWLIVDTRTPVRIRAERASK